jgi:hypothetical protein
MRLPERSTVANHQTWLDKLYGGDHRPIVTYGTNADDIPLPPGCN